MAVRRMHHETLRCMFLRCMSAWRARPTPVSSSTPGARSSARMGPQTTHSESTDETSAPESC